MHFSKDIYILPGCTDTEKKIEKKKSVGNCISNRIL
jgi:hypothetical protein